MKKQTRSAPGWVVALALAAGHATSPGVSAAPVNDTCETALNLATLALPHVTTDIYGEEHSDEFTDGCVTGGWMPSAIWYTFTPPTTGEMTIGFQITNALDYTGPATISVFTGTPGIECGGGITHPNLTRVGCAPSTPTLSMNTTGTFLVTGGTKYLICVGNGSPNVIEEPTATFTLTSFSFSNASVPVPANDLCTSPTTISSLPFSASVQFINATDDVSVSCDNLSDGTPNNLAAGRGVWYTYTPAQTQLVQFEQLAEEGEAFCVLGIFTGTCGSLTEAKCIPDHGGMFLATAGTTYRLLVSQAYADAPPINAHAYIFTLTSLGAPPPAPANDLCSNAKTIAALPYADTVVVGGAGNDIDTICNDSPETFAAQGVWYRYQHNGPFQQLAVFSEHGTGRRPVTVFEGTSCGSLFELYCGSLSGSVIFPAEPGATYYFLTHNYQNRDLYPATNAEIRLRQAIGLVNDFCGDAVEIESFPYSVAFDNNLATEDPLTPVCHPRYPFEDTLYKSVYFTFTPTQDGTISITTRERYAQRATLLCTGPCNDLEIVACNYDSVDPENDPVAAPVVAGTTYTIAIGRMSGGGTTVHEMDVVFTPGSSCPADFNGDNTRDVSDLFAYINAWLAKTANADFNDSGNVDVADLFAYINAWLAGC